MPSALGCVAVIACLACGQTAQQPPGAYLFKYQPNDTGVWTPQCHTYIPQPGDLVFFDDHSTKWGMLYKMVGSGPPFHSGLVIALPDGTPAILESGPDDTQWVRIMPFPSRLQEFKGDVWIRQVKQPISPECNTRLTQWALAQECKRYAVGRLLLQGTPIRCRSPLQLSLFGATRLDRNRWLCSELVVAGGTVAGLFDPCVHFANAIYPRDIIFDNKYDLSHVYHEARFFSASPLRMPPGMVPR